MRPARGRPTTHSISCFGPGARHDGGDSRHEGRVQAARRTAAGQDAGAGGGKGGAAPLQPPAAPAGGGAGGLGPGLRRRLHALLRAERAVEEDDHGLPPEAPLGNARVCPTLRELEDEVASFEARSPREANSRRPLENRLHIVNAAHLGDALNVPTGYGPEHLLGRVTVLELDRVESLRDQRFVAEIFLASIWEHKKSIPTPPRSPG